MDCENNRCSEKALPPLPPALPLHFHEKGGLRRSIRCCIPNAVNSSWDRLFDEAYGADVSIVTDGGAVIYAHSAVLVSSYICVYSGHHI